MDSLPNNRALLIGVGADLPNTVTDAQGLAGILTDPTRCRYPAPNVAVLTEQNATRERVLAALDELATAAVAESTVIIYYSGQGYRFESSTGESYQSAAAAGSRKAILQRPGPDRDRLLQGR